MHTRLLLPLWAVFIALAAALTYPALHRTLYDSALIPGAALIAFGFFVYSRSFDGFNRIKVSGLSELEPDRHEQSLITSGIRGGFVILFISDTFSRCSGGLLQQGRHRCSHLPGSLS